MGKAEVTVKCFDLKIKGDRLVFSQRSEKLRAGEIRIHPMGLTSTSLMVLAVPALPHLDSRLMHAGMTDFGCDYVNAASCVESTHMIESIADFETASTSRLQI